MIVRPLETGIYADIGLFGETFFNDTFPLVPLMISKLLPISSTKAGAV